MMEPAKIAQIAFDKWINSSNEELERITERSNPILEFIARDEDGNDIWIMIDECGWVSINFNEARKGGPTASDELGTISCPQMLFEKICKWYLGLKEDT